jgi:surface carbohydrate biosynthesis protein
MQPSTLIVPVESRVRELDAKLLLAAVAAERGFPVVLGSRQEVNFAIPRLPRGVFFAKSMRFTSDRMTRLIGGLGHHLVATDEESLVRFSSPEYYAWRFSPPSFKPLRHLFAWGEDDAAMFRAYPGRGDVTVHVTGNPRLDLLREDMRSLFETEAAALRARHGRFILVNTNFSFVNAFVRELNLVQQRGTGRASVGRTGRGMSLEFAEGMARHQQAIFDGFAALMPTLASSFPQHTVILRPHPSEDHERWRRLTAAEDNVLVLHQGNVVPWLMAAEVLVHNGCTTAVEGALLGTPAVAFRPVQAECYDYHLPNSLSVQTESVDSTLDAIKDVLHGRCRGIDDTTRSRILARHVDLRPGRLAADRIIDVLEADGYLSQRPPEPDRAIQIRSWCATQYRTAKKHFNRLRPHHRNGTAYLRHRFPPLGTEEVEHRLDRLRRRLNRFYGLKARPLGRDLFAIEHNGGRSRPRNRPREVTS